MDVERCRLQTRDIATLPMTADSLDSRLPRSTSPSLTAMLFVAVLLRRDVWPVAS